MNNLKKTTSISFDSEFLSTVRFYLGDDLKVLSNRVKLLFNEFRDYDLCRIEDSSTVNHFKRDVLAILAIEQHRYHAANNNKWGFEPSLYCLDTCAANAATKITEYVNSWWNCGA